MIEGSGSGSIPLTNVSGSGWPKNMWIRWIRIRIRNTVYKYERNKQCCCCTGWDLTFCSWTSVVRWAWARKTCGACWATWGTWTSRIATMPGSAASTSTPTSAQTRSHKKKILKPCCGSMNFWYGYESAGPYLWLMDRYPAIFVSDLQDINKKLLHFFAYYFLKVHLHHFSKIQSHKEVIKQ